MTLFLPCALVRVSREGRKGLCLQIARNATTVRARTAVGEIIAETEGSRTTRCPAHVCRP